MFWAAMSLFEQTYTMPIRRPTSPLQDARWLRDDARDESLSHTNGVSNKKSASRIRVLVESSYHVIYRGALEVPQASERRGRIEACHQHTSRSRASTTASQIASQPSGKTDRPVSVALRRSTSAARSSRAFGLVANVFVKISKMPAVPEAPLQPVARPAELRQARREVRR